MSKASAFKSCNAVPRESEGFPEITSATCVTPLTSIHHPRKPVLCLFAAADAVCVLSIQRLLPLRMGEMMTSEQENGYSCPSSLGGGEGGLLEGIELIYLV